MDHYNENRNRENGRGRGELSLTAVAALMLVIPWTILPLRTMDWALKSPAAEIIIGAYGAFMILCGIYAIAVYASGRARNTLMKVCVVIEGIYAVVGAAALILMAVGKFG